MQSIELSTGPVTALAGTQCHQMARLTFARLAEAALASAERQATAADLANFAQAGVTLLFDTMEP